MKLINTEIIKHQHNAIMNLNVLPNNINHSSMLIGILVGKLNDYQIPFLSQLIDIVQYIQALFMNATITYNNRVDLLITLLNLTKDQIQNQFYLWLIQNIHQDSNVDSIIFEYSKQHLENKQEQKEQQMCCDMCQKKMKGNQIQFLSCSHLFHKQCLIKYIKLQIQNKLFPPSCPSCGKQIILQQIEQLVKFIKGIEQYKKQLEIWKKQKDQMSISLIKKLMAQQQKIKQSENPTCEVCFDQLYGDKFMPLSCGQVFHNDCLRDYYKIQIQQRKFPLICPNGKCRKQLLTEDLKSVLSPQLKSKYQQFSIKNYVDNNLQSVSWCPTADCKHAFFYQPGQNNFKCPSCNKNYCLKCKAEWHKNMTCEQFQIARDPDKNQKKFEQFVRGSKYKQCPKCKQWVMKQVGCDSMTCRCGNFFCYKCGQQQQFDHGPCLCTNPPRAPVPIKRVDKKKGKKK